MPDWHPEANELFLQALEIPEPEDRQRFLDRACAGKPELRTRVDGLLRAGAEAGSFLEQPAAPELTASHVPATADEPAVAPAAPGTVVGRYKLLEVVGEGGMGIVWLAEQTEPVRRKVALKVVKPGMDSRQVLARFEAERQALALMDHPNIAKVLDGGATADGRPYFAMELVKGVPITKYCDDHRLPPRQRLELFLAVCQAVQHAHQKGVIHRDIKPSNVLVAPYDGRPVPKVIDFGIAKATGQPLTERTLFTGLGAVVGTPEYMSPEQAELNNQDIDTRSDVYSLGVLLYELLTGSTPLTRERLKAAALLEMLRVIREEEAPKPSTRLSTTDELPSIAAKRGLEPKGLSGLVRGELDWIVMKSLEKDRSRRYESANGFATDVERYLADEAVQACPPSAGYRLRKAVRRNRVWVGTAALVTAALVAGTAVSAWQAVRATRAEATANNALALVTAEQAKTETALAAETAANARTREALDALTDDVLQPMFARQPELDGSEKAYLRKVLALYEPVVRGAGETAGARFARAKGFFRIAYISKLLGDNREAESAYLRATAVLRLLSDEFSEVPEYRQRLAQALNNLAIVRVDLGRDAEAELSQARTLRTELADRFPKVLQYRRELATTHNDLGYLLQLRKRTVGAEEEFREAVSVLEKLVAESDAAPEDHQALARTRSNLGAFLREKRKFDEAQNLFRQAIAVQEQNLAKSQADPKRRRELADSYHGSAILFATMEKESEATTAFDRASALRKKLVDSYPGVAQYRLERARALLDQGTFLRMTGRLGAAEAAWDGAREIWARLVADSPERPEYQNELAGTLGRLASIRQLQNDPKGAVTLLEQARPHHEAALRISPKNAAFRGACQTTLATLAQCLLEMNDHVRLAAAAEELAGFGYDPVNDSYNAAICLCRCTVLAGQDEKLTEAERQKLSGQYTDRALALVARAVGQGYKDSRSLRFNPAFGPLRDRAEFKRSLAALEKNPEE
jgi:tetratricopeptide (TPR) repeat protein